MNKVPFSRRISEDDTWVVHRKKWGLMYQAPTHVITAVLVGLMLICLLTFTLTTSITAQPPDESPDEAVRINTHGWTDSPYLTPDGKRLYFMYTPFNFMPWLLRDEAPARRGPDRPGHHSNPDGNPWGDSDLYVSERQPDGTWSAPVNLPFNDDGADACVIVTADGKAIYWQKEGASTDIYVVRLGDDNQWDTPTPLPAPVNTPDYHELNPHVSADENTLYFSSDRPGGYGGLDLYVTKRLDDDQWSEPQNLGATINTADDEDQVWTTEDQQTMYFNGGEGIYRSDWDGEAWSAPVVVEFVGGAPAFAAEVSITSDGQTMVLAVADIEAERLWIMESALQPDGRWSQPVPLD